MTDFSNCFTSSTNITSATTATISDQWVTASTAGPFVSYEFNYDNTIRISADDIIFKDGSSLKKMIDDINDRLIILKPDPAKLEKYDALKKAYEHYKLLEKLLYDQDDKK